MILTYLGSEIKMLGNLIGGFITILIGTSLMPVVADAVYTSVRYNNGTIGGWLTNTNISTASSTVIGLVTLFYSLALMSTGIAIAVSGLKQAGIM